MATKQKRITFKLPDIEYERIQALSERTGRTMTDILREFIRSLPDPEPKSESEKKSEKK
jgi:predicted DNA-binding protein